VDWIVGPAPAEFVMTLERMRAADQWRAATEELIRQWAAGVHLPGLDALVAEMITAPASMWDRVAREIEGAYAEHVSPLNALTELAPPVPTLHLHSRLRDREAEAAQWHFAQRHPWFRTRELPARSHFPMFEVPSIMAEEIEAFAESLPMSRHRPRGVRRAA
jgi:pimeloyl-ACP methyl ester carboxylesterase